VRGQRTVLLTVLAGGAIAFVVSEVRGVHDFHLLALPGMFFSRSLTNNVHPIGLALVFMGNWIFYSAVVGLVLAIARKVRAHRDG
jgi:hypothetical protein